MEVIKQLSVKYPEQYAEHLESMISLSCIGGHLDMAHCLYNSCNGNVHVDVEYIFDSMIINSTFDVGAWLDDRYLSCMYKCGIQLLAIACDHGDVCLMDAIVTKCAIDVHSYEIGDEFYLACCNNDVEVVEWLIKHSFDCSKFVDNDFVEGMMNWDTEMQIWILKNLPGIDIHSNDEYLFAQMSSDDMFDALVSLNAYDSGVHYLNYGQYYLVSNKEVDIEFNVNMICLYDDCDCESHTIYHIYSVDKINDTDLVAITKYIIQHQKSHRKKSAMIR